MSNLTGETFQDADVAAHYPHRPPYAAQIYGCIANHAPTTGRLLDLGCGEGKIARAMAPVFDQVVAVDPSAPMIQMGQSLPGGRAPNLSWVIGKAETAPLSGLFDVVTFASSLHWMHPKTLFARLSQHLVPDHRLAIVSGDGAFAPQWEADWQAFLAKWVPEVSGRAVNAPAWRQIRQQHDAYITTLEQFEFLSDPIKQSVESYILSQHARNTFALSQLGDRAPAFRDALAHLLAPHADDAGLLTFQVKTSLTLAQLAPQSA